MLSAIVVNYRNAADTAACIASLLSDDPTVQVVVVDNSADPQHADELHSRLNGSVQLIINPHNAGFGVACNQGLAACERNEVMLLNPDARVVPGALRRMQQILIESRANRQRLAAVSPLQVWDEAGQWLLPPAWLPTGIGLWALTRASRSERDAQRISYAYQALAKQVWQAAQAPLTAPTVIPQRALSGGAVMFRRDAIEQVGGLFDERYFMYYEDSDLCLRLRRAGWQLGLVPQARAVHAWAHSASKVQWMEQARGQYLAKHFDGAGAWQTRLARIHALPALPNPLSVQTSSADEPHWQVPAHLQGGWLLEVSPSALLVPSIGHFAEGPLACLPAALRMRLGSGPVYTRVSARDEV